MSQREATTERRLIEIIRRAARRAPAIRIGIGDDCAVLEPTAGSVLLATTDLLIEDVHFRRRWATPTDIGWEAPPATAARSGAAAGLALLEATAAPAGVPGDARADVTAAHLRPHPRTREGQWLSEAGGVTSMIDLSDGLATDLGHLCEESGVGARVDVGRVPVEASVQVVARALGRDTLHWATGGGEDYELLLTCSPEPFDRLAGGLARSTGTKLTAVGGVTQAGEGIRYLDACGEAISVRPGFEHFVTGRARV